MQLKSGLIEARQENGIGWLIFNNPAKLNAISLDMTAEALSVIEAYETMDTVQVVVMRGTGEKAFISGGDISKFDSNRSDAEAERTYRELPERFHSAMANLSKPLIAMIHGYCLGGGMAVALAADLRFVSSEAKLGIPAARRGIAYPASALARLIQLVGPSIAKDLMFSARQVPSDEALQLGLANRVFAPAALEEETVAYARAVAENAPLAVRASKFFINQLGLEVGKRDVARMQSMVDAAANSQDFKEATQAFLEKRKPTFRGL